MAVGWGLVDALLKRATVGKRFPLVHVVRIAFGREWLPQLFRWEPVEPDGGLERVPDCAGATIGPPEEG